MALAVYFPIENMSPQTFAAIHERLEAVGQADPPGRIGHVGFRVGDGIQVFDTWDSEESFAAFGEHLMPILAEMGVDPGQPLMGEVELLRTGAQA